MYLLRGWRERGIFGRAERRFWSLGLGFPGLVSIYRRGTDEKSAYRNSLDDKVNIGKVFQRGTRLQSPPCSSCIFF